MTMQEPPLLPDDRQPTMSSRVTLPSRQLGLFMSMIFVSDYLTSIF